MNNLKNNVRLAGYAGNDLIVTLLENNKKVGRVSIAINEYYKSKAGEDNKQTQWFNLVFWNEKADAAAKLIKKGTEIAIEGRLVSQIYLSKEGQKRYTMEVVVNQLNLVLKPELVAV